MKVEPYLKDYVKADGYLRMSILFSSYEARRRILDNVRNSHDFRSHVLSKSMYELWHNTKSAVKADTLLTKINKLITKKG